MARVVRRRFAMFLFLLWMPVLVLRGQGCSQCRDTVSQTNPAVQSSYRLAILLMIAAAGGVGTAVCLVFRRMR